MAQHEQPLGPTPDAQPSPPSESVAVAERPKVAPPRVDKLPLFKVLLHNDDVNEMDFVVKTVVELTPLDLEKSVIVTIEAHKTGVSLLLVTHKERAELYCEQFRTKKLIVTMEEA